MGIDIYLKWDGMTEEDKAKQIDIGFSTTAGEVGYLREAYHGGPYATQIFFREAFESDDYHAEIAAAVMAERMNNVTEPAMGCDNGHYFSQLMQTVLNQADIPKDADTSVIMKTATDQVREIMERGDFPKAPVTTPMTGREAIYTRCLALYPEDGKKYADDVFESFKRFIALAARKERETGKPCTVFASY